MKTIFYTLLLTLFLVNIYSCQKSADSINSTNSSNSNDTVQKSVQYVNVITNVKTWDGGHVSFSYDTLQKRYTSINGLFNDNTLFYYSSNGRLQGLEHIWYNYPDKMHQTTVLQYNNNGLLTKIISKKSTNERDLYYTRYTNMNVNDSSAIGSFDSLYYDNKNRISKIVQYTYSYTSNYISSYSYLKYGVNNNESLLSEYIEYYNYKFSADTSNAFELLDDEKFYSYDSCINPINLVCPIYALIRNKTTFYSQAYSGLNKYNSDNFLNFGKHNCTNSSINGAVVYKYDSLLNPITCYYPTLGNTFINGMIFESSQFYYKKIIK